MGIDSSQLSLADAVVTNGSVYSNGNELIIGTTTSKSMNKTVGDTLNVSGETFKLLVFMKQAISWKIGEYSCH